MGSRLNILGLTLLVCSQLSNAQDSESEIVIANPNATFLAQLRALPPAEVIVRSGSLEPNPIKDAIITGSLVSQVEGGVANWKYDKPTANLFGRR